MKAHKVLLLVFTLVCSMGIYAQNLVVNLSNSSFEQFALDDIQSIKFGPQTMILNQVNGTINTWAIADLDDYTFGELLSIDELGEGVTNELSIFPNPATDKIHIKYTSHQGGDIHISIYDNSGRLVEELFNGDHNEATQITWNAKDNSMVQSGKYIVRLSTGNKVVTKPVIIQ